MYTEADYEDALAALGLINAATTAVCSAARDGKPVEETIGLLDLSTDGLWINAKAYDRAVRDIRACIADGSLDCVKEALDDLFAEETKKQNEICRTFGRGDTLARGNELSVHGGRL